MLRAAGSPGSELAREVKPAFCPGLSLVCFRFLFMTRCWVRGSRFRLGSASLALVGTSTRRLRLHCSVDTGIWAGRTWGTSDGVRPVGEALTPLLSKEPAALARNKIRGVLFCILKRLSVKTEPSASLLLFCKPKAPNGHRLTLRPQTQQRLNAVN